MSVDPPPVEERLFEAARHGDVATMTTLLDAHPHLLHARAAPYEWSLLHLAARHLDAVEFLLARGLDVNLRERGDNTYAMHWAAAGGHLDVVRRLADAGGDVVGDGDDHELEVIGWATCWDGCDDEAHRAVAEFLVSRGARHHVFSAIALNLADELRRLAAEDPPALNRRQSRHENHRAALHFAVIRKRPEMIALLLELGADPLVVDHDGQTAVSYATSPDVDRPVMERIHAMTAAELLSASRGQRPPRLSPIDLVAALALHDWDVAERLLTADRDLISPRSRALHLMARRNDAASVKWLLEKGADPSGRAAHWDTDDVTPMHLAASQGHADVMRLLLDAGGDVTIRDSRHDSDIRGWAEFFRQPEIVRMLDERPPRR